MINGGEGWGVAWGVAWGVTYGVWPTWGVTFGEDEARLCLAHLVGPIREEGSKRAVVELAAEHSFREEAPVERVDARGGRGEALEADDRNRRLGEGLVVTTKRDPLDLSVAAAFAPDVVNERRLPQSPC